MLSFNLCSLWFLIKKSGSVRMKRKRLSQSVWIQACHFRCVPSVATSKPTLMTGVSTFSFQCWSSKCSGCTETKSNLLHYLTLDRHLNVNQVLQSSSLTHPLVLKLKYCQYVSVGQERETCQIQSRALQPFPLLLPGKVHTFASSTGSERSCNFRRLSMFKSFSLFKVVESVFSNCKDIQTL